MNAIDAIINTFKRFEVVVRKPSGEPLPGATVRVVRAVDGVDVTAQLTGKPNPSTDAFGRLLKTFLIGPLPPALYYIQIRKRGWINIDITTAAYPNFTGIGRFEQIARRQYFAGSDYIVSTPPPIVSALAPIVFTVDSPTGAKRERIKTIVTGSNGVSSAISTEVDPSGRVEVDISSRIRLEQVPTFVPDGSFSVTDPNFTDEVTITLASQDPDGELVIPLVNGATSDDPGIKLLVANILPRGGVNSLDNFAAGERDWICPPYFPLRVARGFYSDVLFWCPDKVGKTVFINQTEYDNDGNVTFSEGTSLPTDSKKAVRYRLEMRGEGSERAELLAICENVLISKMLNVKFYA